jgi:tRNA (cmo5U34)-methyltransferase
VADHQQRFRDAGFDQSMVWFQCFNFVSMLALKS